MNKRYYATRDLLSDDEFYICKSGSLQMDTDYPVFWKAGQISFCASPTYIRSIREHYGKDALALLPDDAMITHQIKFISGDDKLHHSFTSLKSYPEDHKQSGHSYYVPFML